VCCRLQVAPSGESYGGNLNAGPAESNGSLLPGIWRDSLPVTCGLTACTPGSAPGPTLGNEYWKTLPLPFYITLFYCVIHLRYLFKYLAAHINRTPPAITPSATPTVTTAIIPAVNTHPQHLHVHRRRQLWSTGARAPPLDFQQSIFAASLLRQQSFVSNNFGFCVLLKIGSLLILVKR